MFEGQVVIFSNSYGAADYDPGYKLAEAFEKENDVYIIRHNSKVGVNLEVTY